MDAGEQSPALTLTRAASAPPPRTLIDIFRETVAAHPDALAVDNGAEMLTYEEFSEAAEALAVELNARRRRARRPGRRTGQVRDGRPLRGDHGHPRRRCGVRPGRRRRPRRTRPAGLRRGRRRGHRRAGPGDRRPPTRRRAADSGGSRGHRRRVDHLHLGIDRVRPKGVAVSHRSAAAFVDAESRMFLQDDPLDETDRVMAGLSVAFDASCEEMWLAWAHGWLPGPGAALPRAQRGRRRPVAGGQRRHRRLDRADAGRALADGVTGSRPAADHGRRGLPAGDRGPPGPARPRAVEHLRPDRGDRGGLRRAAHR